MYSSRGRPPFTWLYAAFTVALLAASGCGGRDASPARDAPAVQPDATDTDAARAVDEPEAVPGSDGLAPSITPLAPIDTPAAAEDPRGSGRPGAAIAPPPLPGALPQVPKVRSAPADLPSPPERAPTEEAAPATAAAAPPAPAADAAAHPGAPAADAAEPEAAYELVEVFYATDRAPLVAPWSTQLQLRAWAPTLCGAGLALVCLILVQRGVLPRGMWVVAGVLLAVTAITGSYRLVQLRESVRTAAQAGVRYGNQRGTLQTGVCQVSIPPHHTVGAIERPSLLRLEVRDDARKHVVLHATEPQEEDEFYRRLRQRVDDALRPEVFVFVHGYNVTFEGAAQRTAQIAYDTQFAGAPIFFSWPSQGGLLRYTVDETNIEWSVPHLKQFLLDVVQHSGATSVNLIAHSMGSRGLTSALRELQRELQTQQTLFNQVILAAPDIDAEIFRRDLAPALVRSAAHVTLYASSNDQALIASRQVHGHARAGDSGPGLTVLPGIETIDVSMLDTSLLGHSYYGTSNPILLDIRQLIEFALPAAQRHWLLPQPHGDLTYWIFERIDQLGARDGEPR